MSCCSCCSQNKSIVATLVALFFVVAFLMSFSYITYLWGQDKAVCNTVKHDICIISDETLPKQLIKQQPVTIEPSCNVGRQIEYNRQNINRLTDILNRIP